MRGAALPARRSASCSMRDRLGDAFGAEQSRDVLERNVRGDARSPELLEHVELAAGAVMLQHRREPAQLVLLLHASGAQRRLVERREAHGVDFTVLREVEREAQRVEHEGAVRRPRVRGPERGRIPAVPLQARHRQRRLGCVTPRHRRQIELDSRACRRGVEAHALRDEPDARIGQRTAIGEHLGDQLGADAGGVAGDECDGGADDRGWSPGCGRGALIPALSRLRESTCRSGRSRRG